MSGSSRFALALAPLRSGYGPTSILDGKPVPPLSLDTWTLTRLDFSNAMPPIVLTASHANTTLLIDSVAGSDATAEQHVVLPDPAMWVGKTFRFEIRTQLPPNCEIHFQFFDDSYDSNVYGVIACAEGNSSTYEDRTVVEVVVEVGSAADAGDWFEVRSLPSASSALGRLLVYGSAARKTSSDGLSVGMRLND